MMTVGLRSSGDAANLIKHLADDVTSTIRSRGDAYLMRGAVTRLEADDEGIRAIVMGSQPYAVTIAYGERPDEAGDDTEGLVVRAACQCPYYAGGEICKHIWATLRAAEQEDTHRLPVLGRYGWAVLERDPSLPLRWTEADAIDEEPIVLEFRDDPPSSLPQARRRQRPESTGLSQSARPLPDWEAAMRSIVATDSPRPGFAFSEPWPADAQILYMLDFSAAWDGGVPTAEVTIRRPKRDGGWTKPQVRRISRRQIPLLPDAADQQILSLLDGPSPEDRPSWAYDSVPTRVRLDAPIQCAIIERMCRTGRCFERGGYDDGLTPLTWQDGEPWALWLKVEEAEGGGCVIRGELRRPADAAGGAEGTARAEGGEVSGPAAEFRSIPLNQPRLLTPGGLMLTDDGVFARFDDHGAFGWVDLLRTSGEVAVPAAQVQAMLEQALTLPTMPPIDLPPRLRVEREFGRPRAHLRIHRAPRLARRRRSPGPLKVELQFHYGDRIVPLADERRGLYDAEQGLILERDSEYEQQAVARLHELGFREPPRSTGWSSYRAEADDRDFVVAGRHVPAAVNKLVGEGWIVEAEGKLYRAAAGLSMDIRGSGVDWFELHGEATFDGHSAGLPALLQALRKGEDFVRLDDGSVGMLPQEWVERYGTLARLSRSGENDHVRLAPTQIGLIDAMLTQMPEVDFDQRVARARKRLDRFSRVRPRKAPRGFEGELRPYQQDGLGWLHFLRQIGFGGCLADDMGLGKTIQVLALLESRRQKRRRDRGATPPSLIVVPRSLVHNWLAEARRFTPRLRLLDHTGPQRFGEDGPQANSNGSDSEEPLAHFADYDVVVTTYGILRQDIGVLRNFRFDYLILDESQAIKNAATASAKAARLLQGDHRLAMSGTPIENHVGELVSLFEFLNPGMLGDPEAWSVGAGARADAANQDQCQLLARAVRPFVLRRTKEQVASDLPEKIEQTLYCDLPPKQREHYEELRRYYGAHVMGKVESRGLKRSKIDVLHALLRLRQAACHPGLIDKARVDEPAAKLDMLLPQIEEIAAEGHKALVFSQFTSFLAIARRQLKARGLDYAYIDGRTRKRQEQVERFQNNPECKLFLISLKAGGTGLNLTAADYVFLLDPWWNPAVEAQAIDRAHRIGQDKRVHAYRLIASDTVEEKVVELQQTKRDLADAIIHADANLIRELSVDDLRYLLS